MVINNGAGSVKTSWWESHIHVYVFICSIFVCVCVHMLLELDTKNILFEVRKLTFLSPLCLRERQ